MRHDWLDVFLVQGLMDGLDNNKRINLIFEHLHT